MTAPDALAEDITAGTVEGHKARDSSSGLRIGREAWLGAERREWEYPTGPPGGVTETIHGVEVRDTWRALEDLGSEETRRFVVAQNALSEPYLQDHPLRQHLEDAVEESMSYTRATCPQLQADGWYYWLFNDGSFQRDVMVRSRDVQQDFGKAIGSGGPEVVYDPNAEGKNLSLYMYSWSPSGALLTLILQESGSDWQTIRTISTATKEPFDVELSYAKFTFGATYVGEQGIMYKGLIGRPKAGAKLDEMGHAKSKFGIFYHKFGTAQDDDVLVWYVRDGQDVKEEVKALFVGRPRVLCGDDREGSGRRSWLYLDLYRNTNPETANLIIEIPGRQSSQALEQVGPELEEMVAKKRRFLTKDFSGDLRYIGTLADDRHLFRSTTDGHTAGRVVAYSAEEYDETGPGGVLTASEVVPPDPEGHVLLSAQLVAEHVLVLVYLRHACAAVVFVDALTGLLIGKTDPKGTAGDVVADGPIELPVPDQQIIAHAQPPVLIPKHASIRTVTSRSDSCDFHMSVDTYISTPYILAGQIITGPHGLEVDVHGLGAGAGKNDDLVCRQVFYPSHDGTRIPMFIAHRADLDLSIPKPSLLYAYGGFATPVLPHFDPLFTAFMLKLGGVLAVANIRGGGEYGKSWHEAAKGVKRWVAWDDHAWAAKYLHQRGISSPHLTTTFGTSNGGTLVSASMIRHPELYRVVLPDVPVEDLLRYHTFTLGRVWVSEYGSPDDPELFPQIARLSPLHSISRVDEVMYPAVLVTTADHDTRVVPSHSLKFIAELQDAKKHNPNALLCKVYSNAGHEAGSKSIKERVGEVVDRLVFVLKSTAPPV